MTITYTLVDSGSSNASSINFTNSVTSSAGDLVIVHYQWDDTGAPATQAAGAVTSTPAKTFTKDAEFTQASSINLGVAAYSWVSDGTTLTNINVSPTVGTSVVGTAGVTAKIASTVGTVTYDSTTKGTGIDAVTPFAWSAGGPVNGTQIGFTLCSVNNNFNGTWTPSSGYTEDFGDGAGSTGPVSEYAHKIGESGTPSLSVAFTGVGINGCVEMFISYKEPGGAVVPPGQFVLAPKRFWVPAGRRRG